MAKGEASPSRQEAALEELYRHSQSLLRLSKVLERAESYDEVLTITQQEVTATTGYATVWVYLMSDDCTRAHLLASGGSVSNSAALDEHAPHLVVTGDPFLEEIVAANDIVVVEDARTDPRTNKEIVAQLGNRTIINVPIIFFDRHLGSIGTGTFGEEGIRVPTEAERSYFSAMASHLAVTLDRIRLLIERRRTEQELRQYKDHLEETVQQRTAELMLARDAAEAANRAKSVFLANMSHELRTPLNAILGFSRMMSDDETLSEDSRENLDIINRSGEHLLRLINDVLEMAQIEAGRLQLQAAPLSLGSMVRDVVDLMQMRCREKGLRLELDQSSQFPLYIKGDEGRLRQILLNLVGNAVKFTERGGVTVRLGVRGEVNTHLLIEVRDTGPGIRDADQERIFEPFFQLNDDASHHGTGLGLAITKQFVNVMGGEISVESEPGRGARFRVDLPLEAVDEADIAWLERERPGRAAGLQAGQPAYRILIAEDQRDNQRLLSRIMTDLDLDLRVADNGEECVELFQQWRPHLIWMDRRMPRMDGVEATRRIRRLPGGGQAKIIAVTASAFARQRHELLEAGVDDFVTKPYRVEELYDRMAMHLGLRYRYHDDEAGRPSTPLTPELLAAVGPELRERLRLALESLDSREIAGVIGQIGGADAELATTLSSLADDFDYPAILVALAAVARVDA